MQLLAIMTKSRSPFVTVMSQLVIIVVASYAVAYAVGAQTGWLAFAAATAMIGVIALLHALPAMTLRRIIARKMVDRFLHVLAAVLAVGSIMASFSPWYFVTAIAFSAICGGLAACGGTHRLLNAFWGFAFGMATIGLTAYHPSVRTMELSALAGLAGALASHRLHDADDMDLFLLYFIIVALLYGEPVLRAAERALT